MGVPFRIVFYASDGPSATNAATAAFARVAELNRIMSDYETDSELNELSRTAGQGKAVPVSDDLWRVLERGQTLAEQTDGAFDITVGPAVSLWRKARRTQQMPEPEKLNNALRAIGYRKLRLHPQTRSVELLVAGMKLDLGGIAKGYAIDEALEVLTARGIARALVAGAGDMAVTDPPPGQTGWRVEIAPLDVPNAPPPQFVRLNRVALATSGDVFQHLEVDGHRYSHIVDPRTAIGLTDRSLVTIIAPDCMTADSLATAVSVLGPAKGLKFVNQVPKTEAHLVRKPKAELEVLQSEGFMQYLEPLANGR
jgi:thiamine biosynthesis lipoprotein